MSTKSINEENNEILLPKPKAHYFYYDLPNLEPEDEIDFEPVEFSSDCRCGDIYTCRIRKPPPVEEHTLAIIKPGAQKYSAEIEKRIIDEGFTILKKKIVQLSAEQASDFYKQYYGYPWFPKVVLKLSKSPVTIMVLAKENAVEDFLKLIGPPRVSKARKKNHRSLRALYGLRGDGATNALHGSTTVENAQREILHFFENANPEPVIEESLKNKMNIMSEKHYTTILDGLTQLCKERPTNPALWFLKWCSQINGPKPLTALTAFPPVTNRKI